MTTKNPIAKAHITNNKGDVDAAALQKQLSQQSEAINSLLAIPLLDGELHENEDFVSGTTKTLKHGLGRPYRGFIDVKNGSATPLRVTEAENTRKSQQILLVAEATTITSIWIF